MGTNYEFNHDGLFPALEALPYVENVEVGQTDTGRSRIEIDITDEGYGPIFADLTKLAERHKIVQTKPVSTCIGLNKRTNTATLTPA